jgi:hypothetical protein
VQAGAVKKEKKNTQESKNEEDETGSVFEPRVKQNPTCNLGDRGECGSGEAASLVGVEGVGDNAPSKDLRGETGSTALRTGLGFGGGTSFSAWLVGGTSFSAWLVGAALGKPVGLLVGTVSRSFKVASVDADGGSLKTCGDAALCTLA